MVGCVCLPIFIRQATNPFSSAKVEIFQYLAFELGRSVWAWRNFFCVIVSFCYKYFLKLHCKGHIEIGHWGFFFGGCVLRSLPVSMSESGLGLGVISAKNSSQSPSLSPSVMPESDLPLSRDELCGQTVTLGLCLVFRDCCFLKRIYSRHPPHLADHCHFKQWHVVFLMFQISCRHWQTALV
jgi:hypothetical protein